MLLFLLLPHVPIYHPSHIYIINARSHSTRCHFVFSLFIYGNNLKFIQNWWNRTAKIHIIFSKRTIKTKLVPFESRTLHSMLFLLRFLSVFFSAVSPFLHCVSSILFIVDRGFEFEFSILSGNKSCHVYKVIVFNWFTQMIPMKNVRLLALIVIFYCCSLYRLEFFFGTQERGKNWTKKKHVWKMRINKYGFGRGTVHQN